MFSLFKFDARRTFRPLRGHQGPGALRLHALSLAQLEAGDMEAAAALPPGVALNDWLAAHVVDFHNAAALIFGLACDGCSAASCPSMNAGPRFEVLWSASGGGAPARLPARDYVDRLFSWIGALLDDPAVFPASSSTAASASRISRGIVSGFKLMASSMRSSSSSAADGSTSSGRLARAAAESVAACTAAATAPTRPVAEMYVPDPIPARCAE